MSENNAPSPEKNRLMRVLECLRSLGAITEHEYCSACSLVYKGLFADAERFLDAVEDARGVW